jgi:ActR/RegA family two-component response regulator
VVNRQVGRPRLDEAAATLLWDVRDLRAGDLEWLRLLAANRPGLFIVIFDSFPRGDTVVAAMRAGAGVVLGRPVSLEAVCGVLLERIPANAGHDGLGRAGNRR